MPADRAGRAARRLAEPPAGLAARMASAGQQVGTPILAGCTEGLVGLAVSDMGVLVMTFLADPEINPENRWTLAFSRAVHVAFDAVETWLAENPRAPAALLTCSASSKFTSNGIDPEWMQATAAAGDPHQELDDWNDVTMPAFARPILLPIPTVMCIAGHCFGAGLMHALAHDYRLQNDSRGFLCAPEVAIGIDIPPPELELFRHAMPVHSFHDTVLSAKRWSGPEAQGAGIVCQIHPPEKLWAATLKFTEGLTKLGKGRKVMGSLKGRTKGHVARGILEYCFYGPQSKGKPQAGPSELPGHGLAKLRDSVAAGPRGSGASVAALLSNAKL